MCYSFLLSSVNSPLFDFFFVLSVVNHSNFVCFRKERDTLTLFQANLIQYCRPHGRGGRTYAVWADSVDRGHHNCTARLYSAAAWRAKRRIREIMRLGTQIKTRRGRKSPMLDMLQGTKPLFIRAAFHCAPRTWFLCWPASDVVNIKLAFVVVLRVLKSKHHATFSSTYSNSTSSTIAEKGFSAWCCPVLFRDWAKQSRASKCSKWVSKWIVSVVSKILIAINFLDHISLTHKSTTVNERIFRVVVLHRLNFWVQPLFFYSPLKVSSFKN